MNNPEIGDELTAAQLQPKTVVVLRAVHRPGVAITMWVKSVTAEAAVFWAGETVTMLALRIVDGKLFDDLNHRIYVHKYLGEI